eukprot:Platyproteum_vivax@DN5016_c0_g1_i1.p1
MSSNNTAPGTVKDFADQLSHTVKFEIRSLKESKTMGSVSNSKDPVFAAYVAKYTYLIESMKELYTGIDQFMAAIDSLASAQESISSIFMNRLSKFEDDFLLAEGIRYREGTQAIGNRFAPHSYYARLRRDLDYNMVRPLMQHILQAERIKRLLDERNKRKIDFDLHDANATRYVENQKNKNSSYVPDIRYDTKYKDLYDKREASSKSLYDYDAPLWEWLMVYNEFQWDLMDSCLQTFKYLQFEFFTGCAHHINLVLPERMEFRPLVEMTPEPHLHQVVKMYLESERNEFRYWEFDATKKLLAKWEEDGKLGTLNHEEEAVDPLDLSTLVQTHKFSAPLAKFALQKKGNIQEALEYLHSGRAIADGLRPHKHLSKIQDRVRMPDTLDIAERLRYHDIRVKQVASEIQTIENKIQTQIQKYTKKSSGSMSNSSDSEESDDSGDSDTDRDKETGDGLRDGLDNVSLATHAANRKLNKLRARKEYLMVRMKRLRELWHVNSPASKNAEKHEGETKHRKHRKRNVQNSDLLDLGGVDDGTETGQNGGFGDASNLAPPPPPPNLLNELTVDTSLDPPGSNMSDVLAGLSLTSDMYPTTAALAPQPAEDLKLGSSLALGMDYTLSDVGCIGRGGSTPVLKPKKTLPDSIESVMMQNALSAFQSGSPLSQQGMQTLNVDTFVQNSMGPFPSVNVPTQPNTNGANFPTSSSSKN